MGHADRELGVTAEVGPASGGRPPRKRWIVAGATVAAAIALGLGAYMANSPSPDVVALPTPDASVPTPAPSPAPTVLPGVSREPISDLELSSAGNGWFLIFHASSGPAPSTALVVSPDGRTRTVDVPLTGDLTVGLWRGVELAILDYAGRDPDYDIGGQLYSVDLTTGTVGEPATWEGRLPTMHLAGDATLTVGGCCLGAELDVSDAAGADVFAWTGVESSWLVNPRGDGFVFLDQPADGSPGLEIVRVGLDGAELSRLSVDTDRSVEDLPLRGWVSDDEVWLADLTSGWRFGEDLVLDLRTGLIGAPPFAINDGWFVYSIMPSTEHQLAVVNSSVSVVTYAGTEVVRIEAEAQYASYLETAHSGHLVVVVEETEVDPDQDLRRFRTLLIDLSTGDYAVIGDTVREAWLAPVIRLAP